EKYYTDQAKALKQRLQENLQGYSVGTCTLRNLTIASPDYPVTSTVSVSLHSSTGNSFQLDVPAKADRTGKWVFPDVTEIVAQIEEIGRSAAQTTNRPAASSVASAPSGRGADRTAVVRWPEGSSASTQSSQSNA